MSCAFSQESNEMLVELLAGEKEDARVWLQAEMDRLVGPFVDSIFNRLTNKLTMNSHLGRCQPDDGSGNFVKVENPFDKLPNALLHQPSPFTPQSLTSAQSQIPIQIKHEIDNANEPIASHFAQSSPIANEQPNHNNWDDDEEEEEECECDDCVNGGLEEIKREDDDDSVELIEYEEEDREQSSRPVKIPRLDTTQPNNATQTEVESDQATQPNQVNSHDKQIITLSLQCPLMTCPDTFLEEQLSQHMMDKHHLGPLRCLVKDCWDSFGNKFVLSGHIKKFHHNTTQWNCDNCPKHFTSYQLLSNHKFDYHQLGQFQCSFPACTFTGEYRRKVFNHFSREHKPTQNCQHFGCNFQTSNQNHLKRHERTHSGIKPYRCRWPNCHYAATQRSHTIGHIRTQHLAPKPGSVPNGAQLDPSDYVEVVQDLL